MSRLYSSVSSYWQKRPAEEEKTPEKTDDKPLAVAGDDSGLDMGEDNDELKENSAPELSSDKKTDELLEPVPQRSMVWRVGSGLYSTTTGAIGGAVGLGVGSVKWAATKSYDAGSVVVSTGKTVVQKVPLPTLKKKDKKE